MREGELREPLELEVLIAKMILEPRRRGDAEQLRRARVGEEAPGVRLRFVHKPNKESASLRDGTVDLETGVVGRTTGPEVRARTLFKDRFIGVVRMGHALSQGDITPSRYASGRHIGVSRRGLDRGPIDEALKPFGLEREIVAIVGSFSTALALARA